MTMYRYFLRLNFVVLALFSLSATAEILSKETIPEKIIAQFYKRHADAADIKAEKTVHFAQELFKVSFKSGEEKQVELYRPDGHFYARGEQVQSIFLMVPGSEQNLKTEFDKFEVKESILIANPNSAGEEYDLSISSAGKNWSVTVDGNGKIVKKEQN